jgi:hypothetical protein
MAIAHPFALDVKAFSAEYGQLRHSVNATGRDETRLQDFWLRPTTTAPVRQIASLDVSTISSSNR